MALAGRSAELQHGMASQWQEMNKYTSSLNAHVWLCTAISICCHRKAPVAVLLSFSSSPRHSLSPRRWKSCDSMV